MKDGLGTIFLYNWGFIQIQKDFELEIDVFVQGCQSYFSHFKIIYYQFLLCMVNSSGRKIVFCSCLKLFFERMMTTIAWVCYITSLYTKTKLVILQPLSLLPLTKKFWTQKYFQKSFMRLKVHLQFLLNLRPSFQISLLSLFLWIEMKWHTFSPCLKIRKYHVSSYYYCMFEINFNCNKHESFLFVRHPVWY